MLRSCIGCGQVDDHPRHDTDETGASVLWHHDCHFRATGCEICEAVAAEGLTGDELREHIRSNDPGREAAERVNERAMEQVRKQNEQIEQNDEVA
jgi:hypothetical protein